MHSTLITVVMYMKITWKYIKITENNFIFKFFRILDFLCNIPYKLRWIWIWKELSITFRLSMHLLACCVKKEMLKKVLLHSAISCQIFWRQSGDIFAEATGDPTPSFPPWPNPSDSGGCDTVQLPCLSHSQRFCNESVKTGTNWYAGD